MSPLCEAAVRLGAKGLRVFPCWPRTKKPCFDDNLKLASVNEWIIRKFWERCEGNCNIGVATGRGSKIWVLDVDDDIGKNGEATLRSLKRSLANCRERLKLSPATADIFIGSGHAMALKSAAPSAAPICPESNGGPRADLF
jgi:hypothetical protein